MSEVRRRDHALPTRAQLADEQLSALGVELAHDVVEQHQRYAAALGGEHGALGEQQGEQGEALLALRSVDAQLPAVAGDRDLVAVRAIPGEAALKVAGEALA